MELNRRYAYFRGSCYDHRAFDWNGEPVLDTNAIPRERSIPPGFSDPYGNTDAISLKYRRPSAPYYLGKVIVKRFTGLLFSHRKHPKVKVLGDPQSEEWLAAAIEAGRLWAQMIEGRDLGGAMGSVAVGYEIHDGLPLFEVFDARFCTPVFKNRLTHELASIEIRWSYKDWVQALDGEWLEVELWSRRIIDEEHDILWQGAMAGENGEEPDWNAPQNVMGEVIEPIVKEHRCVDHRGRPAVPVEWIQNLPVSGEIDGDPDCHGAYDLFEQIDALTAQANRGILANCDPTLVMSTDDELAEIRKGSDTFIRLPKGDSAEYLEMQGSGPKSAIDQADRLEDKALRLTQCVLDQSRSTVNKTATEVEKDYSAMWEKADVLREQYGERGLKRLLMKLLATARALLTAPPTQNPETGELERVAIILPPKIAKDAKGKVKVTEYELGPGGYITFQWPGYTTPTVSDARTAVGAASDAMNAGLVDDEHAAAYIAPIFQVEDPKEMLAAIAKKRADEEAAFAAQTTGDATAPVEAGGEDGEGSFKTFQYEMEAGIVTIDEMRMSKGLPPLAIDGDLTVPQMKAKYAAIYAQSTMVSNETGAEKVLGIASPDAPPANQ